ncbi:MAG: glycosyltransferase family 4 protein, partial [Chlorobiales bacterium]|nr:glycosyltransferase family 4 protein [Chlorobiales bacterium]
MILGIDAFNLSRGGGITHLVELLRAASPDQYGFERVILWGSRKTLAKVDDQLWLQKVHEPLLDRGLLSRVFWHRVLEKRRAKAAGCHIVFLPGGTATSGFSPVVTMSRNMLPFEWQELRRYGLSLTTLKLLLLRFTQSRSFRAADGVIFLTGYAHQKVLQVTGLLKGVTANIPHGLSSRFSMPPRPQRTIEAYSDAAPYRLLYVSIIDQYKHQWQVVEGVAKLRQATGWPLRLDLVGPAFLPALRRLQKSLHRF